LKNAPPPSVPYTSNAQSFLIFFVFVFTVEFVIIVDRKGNKEESRKENAKERVGR
jgi:hypothetical protein